MSKQPRQQRPEPPGDFKSINITMDGKPYQTVGGERRDDGSFWLLIKNQAGETKWMRHETVKGKQQVCGDVVI